MERDLYLTDAAALKERLAKMPVGPPDIDAWIPGELKRVNSLSEAALLAEWQAANDAWFEREKERRRLEFLRNRFSGLRGTLGQEIGKSEAKARQAEPPILTEAIAWMKSEIRERSSWGKRENPTYIQKPNGRLVLQTDRTGAHDEAQARAEQALNKLEALVLVPGDLAPAVKAILDGLHASDMADYDKLEDSATPTPESQSPGPRGVITKAAFSEAVAEIG